MAFFVFAKVGNSRLSRYGEIFSEMKKGFIYSCFFLFLYKTNKFHVALRLFSNRSQKMSKCGKNIGDTQDFITKLLVKYDLENFSLIG